MDYRGSSTSIASKIGGWACLLVSVVMVAFGVWVFFLDVESLAAVVLAGLVTIGFGTAVGYLGYTFLTSSAEEREAEETFDTVLLDTRDDVLEPGDTTEVDLLLSPNKPVSLNGIYLRLVSFEMVREHRKHSPDIEKRVEWYDEPQKLQRRSEVTLDVTDGTRTNATGLVEIPTDPNVHFGETGPLDWEVVLVVDCHLSGEIRRRVELSVDERSLRDSRGQRPR